METSNILDANCTNCEYVKYEHTDGIRLEKCSVFHRKGKFNSLPINKTAEEAVLNGHKGLCEKYDPAKSLIQQGMMIVYL